MIEQIESIKNQILELPVNIQGRRTYSKSIKSAIRKLHGDGMSLKLIADKTGIHVTTLYYWCGPPKPKSGFKEVNLKSKVEPPVGIEIYFPSGAKALGLSFIDFTQILKQELIR